MNLNDITTKCFILALIIRDDGERLLLGDGFFEFNDKLQHFQPNTYVNDVVELQGTDGQLLAGQVRRTASQPFDGYIADPTVSQTNTEINRQRFIGFFRKKHFYKVVYVMPDGTAIKRDRGYIVDAPKVAELYQRYPEYHVALNFEDPNYYQYDEDSDGKEIYTHVQSIAIWKEIEAGLVWDALGAVSDEISWSQYTTMQTLDGYVQIWNGLDIEAPLSLTHLYGNATQETIDGKNLFDINNMQAITRTTVDANGWATATFDNTSGTTTVFCNFVNYLVTQIPTNTACSIVCEIKSVSGAGTINTISVNSQTQFGGNGVSHLFSELSANQVIVDQATTKSDYTGVSLGTRTFVRYGAGESGSITYRMSLIVGTSVTPQNFVYTPFVGGSDSPNPSYPQTVNVVTGAQTVQIMGKNWTYNHATSGSSQGITYTVQPNGDVDISAGTATGTSSFVPQTQQQSMELPAGTWTISTSAMTSVGQIRLETYAPSDLSTRLQLQDGDTGSTYATITTTQVTKLRVSIIIARNGQSVPNMTIGNFMLEKSATPTSYEPYQTQSQVINLGSLELAKIGTYQDYIWNDDGTWKIHKEVGKVVLDGSNDEDWAITNTGTPNFFYRFREIDNLGGSDTIFGLCNIASPNALSSSNTLQGYCFVASTHNDIRIRYGTEQTIAQWQAFLAGEPLIAYYPLATPTDTEITDSELIEQLDHIYSLYGGVNNIMLIPSGGAQGEMEVIYGSEYVDEGSGYHWDEGAGQITNIVVNDGIDYVRPIWSILGPAINPTLTNITTAQTITWQGTVPADQTLIIDMQAQTATIAGTNVFQFLEGDWLELAVGPNRIEYTADVGSADESTLEWNGVAG